MFPIESDIINSALRHSIIPPFFKLDLSLLKYVGNLSYRPLISSKDYLYWKEKKLPYMALLRYLLSSVGLCTALSQTEDQVATLEDVKHRWGLCEHSSPCLHVKL